MTKSKKQISSSLGGKTTLERHPEHFSEIAKRAWLRRKLQADILKQFTLEELQNPITLKSIQDKLESIDKI